MPAIEGEACAAREGGYAAEAWREEACAARTICNRSLAWLAHVRGGRKVEHAVAPRVGRPRSRLRLGAGARERPRARMSGK